MNRQLDIDLILAPIEGDNPAGRSLRYEPVLDEIKEARRADDPLNRGDWQQDLKISDWDKVITLSVDALTQQTKDLQIGVWLTEALVMTEGFEGFIVGMNILNSFLVDFWDHVYPEIEDDDLDYRVGPLEFLNEKLWVNLKEVPFTDRKTSNGYSWLKWQESRQVGSDENLDDSRRAVHDEMIAEGKLPPEDFDIAVARSSKAFYVDLADKIEQCLNVFGIFDATVDEKFGKEAPRLAELRECLEDCNLLCTRILKEKRELEPDPEPELETGPGEPQQNGEEVSVKSESEDSVPETSPETSPETAAETVPLAAAPSVPGIPAAFTSNILPDMSSRENTLWKDALETLKKSGIKTALTKLLNASCVAPSVREQNRFRLLIAKLCIKAKRPELARPIVEQLHAMIEELNLEKWESPVWIAEVFDAYYRCLTRDEGATDDDVNKANTELFQKLCTTDITKAINCKIDLDEE